MMFGREEWLLTGMVAGLIVLTGCPAKKPVAPPTTTPSPVAAKSPLDARYATPVPTVPPSTPLATRPVPNLDVKATKGKPIGPVITHFGAARADGNPYEPMSVDKSGVATYKAQIGSGFMIVVEAKPGLSNYEVARSIFSHDAKDPEKRPDLQIQSNQPLGDGSEAVCDRRKPIIGGIPAINPPSFADTQKISDTLNDFSCRFETFLESSGACTKTANGDFSFVKPDSATQFCMIVAHAWAFPVGTTVLSVRLRDSAGNPGPVKKVKIYRPVAPERPKRTPTPQGTPTPKALPTR